MKNILILCIFTAILSCVSSGAHADTAAGWAAYKDGQYDRAAALFEQDNSAEAHMGACRSWLVIGGFFRQGDAMVDALHRAIDHCAAAKDMDPSLIDAQISYAVAIGLEGKRLKSPKLAKRCRHLLEEQLVVWNNYSELLAALGGWHTQVHEAGFMARLFLGARRSKAEDMLKRAVSLAPDNLAVRLEWIKFLALGKKDDRAAALTAFEAFDSLEPQDAFEAYLKLQAISLRTALQAGDKRAAEQAVDAVSAFTGIEEMKDLPTHPLAAQPADR